MIYPQSAAQTGVTSLLDELLSSFDEIELSAGSGRVGEGRSTAGDGTSNPGVNSPAAAINHGFIVTTAVRWAAVCFSRRVLCNFGTRSSLFEPG